MNSASEAAIHKLQIPAVAKPQMTDTVPPLGKARDRDADKAVQVFRMVNARPNMANGEN